jgi:vacuolar fusion protein MON1
MQPLQSAVFLLSNHNTDLLLDMCFRHGSEDKLATIFGVMQALVSFVETNHGDVIRSMHAGDTQFVFLVKDHVILVSVSKTGEKVPQLVLQLM